MSYQEQITGNQIYYVFGLSLLLVYLVLAGQYESWLRPLAVILSVPLSLLGVATALYASGFPNDLYTQIGLILLIALSAKNAILVVEYARDEHEAGVGIAEAAVEAARRRLRPNSDDVFRVHSGCFPAGGGNGRRGIRAQVDRHRSVQRHARIDAPCDALCAFIFRSVGAV